MNLGVKGAAYATVIGQIISLIMALMSVMTYGLYYKVQQFVLFAAFGLRDAITPIVSFSHGMQNKKRINEGVKYGIIYTTIIRYGKNVYIGDADNIGRIFFAGANIAFQGIFQALDGGMESYLLSLPVRNNPGKIWLVWLTFIFAEGMSLIISLLFMKKVRKNVINNVKEADYYE